jgi:hypothetical protein
MVGTNAKLVKEWRIRTKERMVRSMGGECQICGYNKSHRALEFHHLDPTQKDFGFGGMRANPKSWTLIAEELKKCILLCGNCHMEIEDGTTDLPLTFATYDATIEQEIGKRKK